MRNSPKKWRKRPSSTRLANPLSAARRDSSLFGKYAKQCADDADAAEVDEEVTENANQEYVETSANEVPANVDPETGEVKPSRKKLNRFEH